MEKPEGTSWPTQYTACILLHSILFFSNSEWLPKTLISKATNKLQSALNEMVR